MLDSTGSYVSQIHCGTAGSAAGQLSVPFGVAVDSSGDVFVADTANNRVQTFDATGAYVSQFGSGVIAGSGEGQFSGPSGVAVDSSGDVYVADRGNDRVEKFGELSTPCSAGSYSTSGFAPCLPADAGSYVSGPGATSETPCDKGSFQPA